MKTEQLLGSEIKNLTRYLKSNPEDKDEIFLLARSYGNLWKYYTHDTADLALAKENFKKINEAKKDDIVDRVMFYVDLECIDLAVSDLNAITKLPMDANLTTEHYVQNIFRAIEAKLHSLKESDSTSETPDSNKDDQEDPDIRPSKIARTEALEEKDLILGGYQDISESLGI